MNSNRLFLLICQFFTTVPVLILTACSKSNPHLSSEQQAHLPSNASITSAKVLHLKNAKDWINSGLLYNEEAPIPSQCYTDTQGKYNPCYVCHQSYSDNRPNVLNDAELQGDYGFSDIGFHNSWKNLFKDRSAEIAQISDNDIIDYIHQDNYSPLLEWMSSDAWSGVNPQLLNLHLGQQAFDPHGLAKDGSYWVAFNYKPLPSTFWPTNGATDDVMVRLPKAFREIDGKFSHSVYYANLTLMELAISGANQISSIPINEKRVNVDLNQDGQLTEQVTLIKSRSQYVGDAKDQGVNAMLYPEGIEFLHTVRYIGVDAQRNIYNAPRMKEVRYMQKKKFHSPKKLANVYYREEKEKYFGELPTFVNGGDVGMSNKHGWLMWGFIEDETGRLRKQTDEEQFFCTGCHKSIGSTIDDTFAFPRKVAGAAGWGYIDLTKMLDTPSRGEAQGEYLTYLERVGGGDEFRQNEEMKQRWFNTDGSVKKDKIQALPSIYDLITPSKERALALNKAYKLIVEEQSFIFGRDTVLKPATNVLKTVDDNKAPLEPEYRHTWDIRPAI